MTPAAERRPLLPSPGPARTILCLLSDGECCEALCRPDTAARALLEARRLADGPMRVSPSGAGGIRESAGAQLSA